MVSGGGADKALADQGKETIDQLEQLGIPYDELHFGKPHAEP